jgi:hypothetical protein
MPTSPLLDTVMAPAEFPNLPVIALQPSTVASLADLPVKKQSLCLSEVLGQILLKHSTNTEQQKVNFMTFLPMLWKGKYYDA